MRITVELLKHWSCSQTVIVNWFNTDQELEIGIGIYLQA